MRHASRRVRVLLRVTPRVFAPLQPHQTDQNGAFVGMRTTRFSRLSRAPGLRLSRCSTLAWHRRPHDASYSTVWEARVAKPWLLPTVPTAATAPDTAGPAAEPVAVSPAVPAAEPSAAEGAYMLRAERLVPAEAMEAARRLVLGLDGQRSSVRHTWLEPRTIRRRVRPQLTCRSAPVRPDRSVTHTFEPRLGQGASVEHGFPLDRDEDSVDGSNPSPGPGPGPNPSPSPSPNPGPGPSPNP